MSSSKVKTQVTVLFCTAWVVVAFCGFAAENATPPQNRARDFMLNIPIFNGDRALKSWVSENLSAADMRHFEAGGRRVYVAVEYIGFGRISSNIYIFIHNRQSDSWGVAAFWRTYTSEVKITSKGKDLIFKSKSGNTLFQVPFEALEPKNDPDY